MKSIFKLLFLILLSVYCNAIAGEATQENMSRIPDEFSHLTDTQKDAMFCEATERPFSSELLHEKRKGIFVCGACGNKIFNSDVKYDSQTGWPSFYDAIEGSVEYKTDTKIGYERTEFHCAKCKAHFGHVFDDGPKPTGKRYCTNGVALKFIPDKK